MIMCPHLVRGLASWGHIPEGLGQPAWPNATGNGVVSIITVPEAPGKPDLRATVHTGAFRPWNQPEKGPDDEQPGSPT